MSAPENAAGATEAELADRNSAEFRLIMSWENRCLRDYYTGNINPVFVKQLLAHVRAALEAKQRECDGLRARLDAVYLVVDGYVDGAPDRGAVANLANEVALIIRPPQP
jgi:hypothetical protein